MKLIIVTAPLIRGPDGGVIPSAACEGVDFLLRQSSPG